MKIAGICELRRYFLKMFKFAAERGYSNSTGFYNPE